MSTGDLPGRRTSPRAGRLARPGQSWRPKRPPGRRLYPH